MTDTMFSFDYELKDLMHYCSELAGHLGVPVTNDNEVIYPEALATGSSRFFKINEYISFQLAQYTANQSMLFRRLTGNSQDIIITFQDFCFSKCTQHNFQCNEIILTNNKIGSVQCKSARIPETVVIESGLQVNVLVLLLKENWLDSLLTDPASKDKFHQYLVHRDANYRKEYLTVEQQKIFSEIQGKQPTSLLKNLYYESRVLNLLESFLSEILQKEPDAAQYISCSDEDIQMIQQAEKTILDNVMEPFVGVDKLCRLCCMSRTKFINLFHKVYGVSSFEYYQKKRLAIAYDMLRSGKYSVSAAASKLGYTNITNFTLAFKRDFGFLPSNLLEEVRNYS